MYVAPLVVDVTWWAAPGTRNAVPLRKPVRDIVLRLYSMLRRHVDTKDPKSSSGEIVVRPGVGIPVSLGRPLDVLASELAQRTAEADHLGECRAVVPILDADTYAEQLGEVRRGISRLCEIADSDAAILVLPVTLDPRWDKHFMRNAPARLSWVPAHERVSRAASAVGTGLARWLMSREAPDKRPAPHVTIFVSHAKADLAATDSAATVLDRHLQVDTALKTFFDAKEIQRGKPVDEQLIEGQRNAVLLSLRTDHYTDSAWCHQEVLTAKALQVPVISVWSVKKEERRALPYGGNMPTLVWDKRALEVIADRCLQAWLHHLHFRLEAPRALTLAGLERDGVYLSRPPELVDFALGGLPVDRDAVVLYPDPPLPAVETRVLRQAHPRVRLATPTTLFGGAILSSDPAPPLAGRMIALSLADSPDASDPSTASNVDGFNALHVDDAIAHLTLCVVRAGARLAYGGHLNPGGFTPFLADIIAVHNQIGAATADIPLVFLANYLTKNKSALDVEQHVIGKDIRIDKRGIGQALQLRAMRIEMAAKCDARIAIGGKDAGYAGRFPGVVEECWRMLESGKPIYPLGGFGGAAGLVADALLGTVPEKLQEARMRPKGSPFDQFCEAFARRGSAPDPATLDELAARVAAHGDVLRGDKPDARWSNGLTVAENLRLFRTRDLTEIAHLVMKGLAIALPRTSAPQRKDGVVIRLFRGSIVDLGATDAYAIPVITRLAPTGAAAAMDERLAGAISTRLLQEINQVEALDAGGARLAGRNVLLVPLGGGKAGVFITPGESVDIACNALAEYVRAERISSLAVVPFGGNIGVAPSAAINRLVAALHQHLERRALTLTICETVKERYDAIRDGLGARFTELPPTPMTKNSVVPAATPIVIAVTRADDTFMLTVLPPSDDALAVVPHAPRQLTADERRRLDVLAVMAEPPAFDKLEPLGTSLGATLLADQLETLERYATRPIDLVHDADSAAIPWELLAYRSRDGTLVFPARESGMRRRLMLRAARIRSEPRRLEVGEKLRVLLVLHPRNLRAGAAEAAPIREVFAHQNERIFLHEVSSGAELATALLERWDVLHFTGHASFDAKRPEESGLLLSDGWFTSAHVASPRTLAIPPLVVLNACSSARVHGPEARPEARTNAAGLAESILVSGARTFIGPFWEVLDTSAARFSDELYRRLLSGDTVGNAVLSARRALAKENQPDWVNYNLYGDTELRW